MFRNAYLKPGTASPIGKIKRVWGRLEDQARASLHVHAAVWVAIPGAIFIFLLDDHHDVEEALHGVEWDTLIFFAALFVMVEGLAEMGLLRLIGGTLARAIEHLAPETRQVYAIILVR